MATTHAPRIKLNPQAALKAHQERSNQAAVDRFSKAEEIVATQPTGLAPATLVAVAQATPSAPAPVVPQQAFDIKACVPGSIVCVPLQLIDPNPLSPRQIYNEEEINVIAQTIGDGQDVAAHGYVQDGRVKLIDGGTRLRAARITDRTYLEVKFEPAPKSLLELFNRARALNEQRSATKALDFALSLKKLLDEGAVATQRDLIEKVKAPGGGLLTESLASTYLRVNRIPGRVQRVMCNAPETSSLAALHAVSELFPEGQTGEEEEAAIAVAVDIVDEIKHRKLNRKQIQDLVKAKLDGPKPRQRSTIHRLDFGPQTGQIKTFHLKGEIQLSLKGLGEDQLTGVRAALQRTLEEYLKDQGA